MTKITELADDVRILELEVQKLEFENRITQLKAKQLIDEECIGCAGPCMVVDVAANLQKELDSCRLIIKNFKTIETKETDRLHKIIDDLESKLSEKPDTIGMLNHTTNIETVVLESGTNSEIIKEYESTIEELKDRNFEDLKELYDLYEAELRGIKADRASIKSDHDIMFQNHRNTVAKLLDDISRLEREISGLLCLRDMYDGLKAELSARKQDSEMLIKVADIVRDDTIGCGRSLGMIGSLLTDYLGAPEGPEDTTIDEVPAIIVTRGYLELP